MAMVTKAPAQMMRTAQWAASAWAGSPLPGDQASALSRGCNEQTGPTTGGAIDVRG